MTTFIALDKRGKLVALAATNLAQARASALACNLQDSPIREATAVEQQALWNSHSLPQGDEE